mmetsp:Transcript_7258/g.17552  ORF Transcript_7258/g.17552 Transcript_7258/m.17552 type:complete len:109 (-) Transcript_7258:18-344(-)
MPPPTSSAPSWRFAMSYAMPREKAGAAGRRAAADWKDARDTAEDAVRKVRARGATLRRESAEAIPWRYTDEDNMLGPPISQLFPFLRVPPGLCQRSSDCLSDHELQLL